MEIFVFNNPGSIPYNAYLYMFVRSWYMPMNPDGSVPDDAWLKVPALKSIAPGGKANYVPCNAHLSQIAMITITADRGVVTKISRARPNKLLKAETLRMIEGEAIDISSWEKENNTSWPYLEMVNKELIRVKYSLKHGSDSTPFFEVYSTNPSLLAVKKQIDYRPCNCGKGKKR